MVWEFFVPGLPGTAGSKRGIPYHRKGGGLGVRVVHASDRTRPWMAAVAAAASGVVPGPIEGAVSLQLTFWLPRPRGHFGTGKNAGVLKSSAPVSHLVKPDLTKLVRCVEDALRGIAWRDDSQVVDQSNAKRYADGVPIGVTVRIYDVELPF